MVLDKLNTIDWSKINHAYGPATDLPTLLRSLASRNKKQREQALWELTATYGIRAQFMKVTAHAVPFLLELVATNPRDPRTYCVCWL